MDPTVAAHTVTRLIESSPVIVLVVSFFAWTIWRAWRQELAETRAVYHTELHEERLARANAHQEMVAVAERSVEAVHAVREALAQLRATLSERR